MGYELDLFADAGMRPEDGAWTVAAVTSRARQLIEAGFPHVWVRGEITNLKRYRSGHWYFTMRDADAQVRCVMWRDDARRVREPPDEGLQVFVEARPTVWEERGEFRLTVRRLIATETGGAWEARLRRARAALEADGLLDPARRRPLPAYPSRIALVTSPDGAAFRDVVSVLQRRWPAVELCLVPTLVQGEGATQSIRRALEVADRIPGVDLIIVGRGGGSREDLWAFNDEQVARAVAATATPVISAVGHETDTSLTDLVADLRAATPSAAAEAAVPDRGEVGEILDGLARHLGQSLRNRTIIGRERVERTGDRLVAAMQGHLDRGGAGVAQLAAQLDALSPLAVLRRGYAVARDRDGVVLRSVAHFPADREFRLTVADGDVRARSLGP